MATCSDTTAGGSATGKSVCVGDCFDVDSRGVLQLSFSDTLNNWLDCQEDGLGVDAEWPLCVSTYDLSTGDSDGDGTLGGDDTQFQGSGPLFRATPGPFTDDDCVPDLFNDSVNPTASQNQLRLRNETDTPMAVEIEAFQWYGAIDNFQPNRSGMSRVLGEVRWTIIDDEFNEEQSAWQRPFELAKKSEGIRIECDCTDCCQQLSDEVPDGEDISPRQQCINAQGSAAADATALFSCLKFTDQLTNTGGYFKRCVTLAPGDTLLVETRTRITNSCEQGASIASRAGAITLTANPKLGVTVLESSI